jgi:hypothetical protein
MIAAASPTSIVAVDDAAANDDTESRTVSRRARVPAMAMGLAMAAAMEMAMEELTRLQFSSPSRTT